MINQKLEKQPTIFPDQLNRYKIKVEEKINEKIQCFGEQNVLRDACAYALLNGGKRIRPVLVLMMAQALKRKYNVCEAALAVEFFHTASLVADDLPLMDDDDQRRNKPSLHKVYGEAMALLVSYGLIAAGYGCIATNAKEIRNERVCAIAVENATQNTGLMGATGGQFLDIEPPNLTETTIKEIIHKKTTSLFEISFVFGWLFGGGAEFELKKVKKSAAHFGLAFQLLDDIDDIEQDLRRGKKINYAVLFGKQEAIKLFHEEIALFHSELQSLNVAMEDWNILIQYMRDSLNQ